MSAEIEAIGSKHAEALAKLEEVAEREANLVESLRKAKETHAAEIEALRAEHAQALRTGRKSKSMTLSTASRPSMSERSSNDWP